VTATQHPNGPRKRPSPRVNDTEGSTALTRRAQEGQGKPRRPKYRIPPGLRRHEHDGRGAYRWPTWPTSLTRHRRPVRKDHQ